MSSKRHRLTEEGQREFPRLKAKRFEVRKYVLNGEYCQARVVGRKTWTTWATSWFTPVRSS